jgi:hypothetical protein
VHPVASLFSIVTAAAAAEGGAFANILLDDNDHDTSCSIIAPSSRVVGCAANNTDEAPTAAVAPVLPSPLSPFLSVARCFQKIVSGSSSSWSCCFGARVLLFLLTTTAAAAAFSETEAWRRRTHEFDDNSAPLFGARLQCRDAGPAPRRLLLVQDDDRPPLPLICFFFF